MVGQGLRLDGGAPHRGVDVRSDHALRLRRADHLGLRRLLHGVRRALHARRRLHPAEEGPHPDGLLLRGLAGPAPGVDRRRLVPRLLLPRPGLLHARRLGRGLALLADARGLGGERLASAALSLQARHARHGGAAPAAGRVRVHQERLGGPDGAVAMSPELLGLVLLFALIGCIFIGFGDIVFNLMVFQTLGMMKEETLAAVPLFIFMGHILEQAGLMERLFKSFQFILAPVRGSLYLGVLLTATIFATATGIIGASVTVMGLMAAPVMIKAGYDPKLSAGSI